MVFKMTDLEAFLDRVCAWPADDNVLGFVNLHWLEKGKSHGMPGKPYRDRGSFAWMVNFLLSKGGKLDLYFCTTRQSQSKVSKAGKPLAIRKAENALASRCVALDIDVKPDDPEKAYPSLKAGYGALLEFCEKTGLPFPNVVVESGGGIHAYWVFDREFTIPEWQWCANAMVNAVHQHGLKFDAACTTDAARVLRLPGTFNHKTDPPKEVKLRRNDSTGFTHEQIVRSLASYGGDAVRVPTATSVPTAHSAGYSASPHPGKAIPLALGWEKPNLPPGFRMENFGVVEVEIGAPLSIRPIVAQCAFVEEAIRTGGRDYDQAQWRYTTLLATALDKGETLAHGMAKGHPEYNHQSTDVLWRRSVTETAERPQLAWVSCRAISATGFGGCAACPHYAKGKSPLHLATWGTVAPGGASPAHMGPSQGVAGCVGLPVPDSNGGLSGQNVAGVVSSPPGLYLPPSYVINPNGLICKMVDRAKRGEPPDEHPTPMFLRPLYEPWAQVGPRGLNFDTEAGYGTSTRKRVFLDAGEMMVGSQRFKDMVAQHVTPNLPFARDHIEEFYVNWLKEVEQAKRAIHVRPFGWMEVDKVPNQSFVYGGRQWRTDGTDDPAGYVEAALQDIYEPIGAREPWIDAAQRFVFDQKRADLECLLASAFAGPLMQFTGQSGALLAVNGVSSAGKSTTIRIAQAVWAHHRKSQETLNSTVNSVVSKMGKLGNIPVYWDEVKGPRQEKALVETAMYLNQGVEKNRMKDGNTLQARRDWCTILVSGSNFVVYDRITNEDSSTDASMRRVFEYTVPKLDMHMAHVDIDMLVNDLLYNYGVVGLEYAKHLALSADTLSDRCKAWNNKFTARVTDRSEERCWTALCATLMLGAELANEMGVAAFDLHAMFGFLVDTLLGLRAKVNNEAIDASHEINIDETLTNFLRDHCEETLFTDKVPWGPGDRRLKVTTLAGPPHDKRRIVAQFVRDENLLRISYTTFKNWLKANEHEGRTLILEGFTKKYNMTIAGATLGACTSYKASCGYERLMNLKIEPYSSLWLLIPGNVIPDIDPAAPEAPNDHTSTEHEDRTVG